MPSVSQRDRWSGGWIFRRLWPSQKLRWTRAGIFYALVWIALLGMGLQQQINLILLIAALAAGPVVGSIWSSAAMVRKLRIVRRVPPYAFSGEPLQIDYTLDNDRRHNAALALILTDEMIPIDRSISGATGLYPTGFFPRVAARSRSRVRWEGVAPRRGRYQFRTFDLVTRSPFGLLERRVSGGEPTTITVYPTVGKLTKRWQYIHREASETRRGSRHDRSIQQQEYHGLREYRSGDSPRWIHWRTSSRVGRLMVKEFEQQHEQDLTILLDPWVPSGRVTRDQREFVEEAIRFAASVCMETCRHTGRRLLLGWTGPSPGLRQGPASVKLLHEMLEQLATVRASAEGRMASLIDVIPPSTLRESILIVVSTRSLNLFEEGERSTRLPASAIRGLLSRVTLLDASKGDLADLFHVNRAARSGRPAYLEYTEPTPRPESVAGAPSVPISHPAGASKP